MHEEDNSLSEGYDQVDECLDVPPPVPSPTSESEFTFKIEQYCETELQIYEQQSSSSSSSSAASFLFEASTRQFAEWYAVAQSASSMTKALALIEKLKGERDTLREQLAQWHGKTERRPNTSSAHPQDKEDTSRSLWTVFNDEHPPPPFGLSSPVVDHLLASWTDDANKVQFFLSWIQCLAYDLPTDFPKGVRIVEVTETIRDGFLMLLLPIIRCISRYKVDAYTRVSERFKTADSSANGQDDSTFADIYREQFM